MVQLRACLLKSEGPSCEASREAAKSLDEGDHTIALSQSALLDLLDALNASDDVDVIRSAVQVMLQELIEAEATALIGAERHERTESRTVQRNGYRPRTLSTTGRSRAGLPER